MSDESVWGTVAHHCALVLRMEVGRHLKCIRF